MRYNYTIRQEGDCAFEESGVVTANTVRDAAINAVRENCDMFCPVFGIKEHEADITISQRDAKWIVLVKDNGSHELEVGLKLAS